MGAMELQAKKMEIVKSINDINDEDILDNVSLYIDALTSDNFPCQYTEEEIIAGAEEFAAKLERGEVEFISHEEVKNRFNQYK